LAGNDDPKRGSEGAPASEGAALGAISRLLLELAQAPEEDLAASWQGTLKPGEVVGRYQIRDEIGRGGFGAVYEAFDPELGRAVALKTLRPGRTRRELTQDWIKKEAEAVARLDHPAIVTVFDVGTCPAGPYLVMELLRGETLQRRLEKGALPADESLRVAEEMARALAHAHHRGVLHRDLKPANIFLTDDGRVKLLDFGLAHLLGREGGSSGGTPAYMAPEQARGEPVDERADVYAAGMVLGEMLTGKRPVEPATPPAPPALAPAERNPAAVAAEGAARTEALWPKASPVEPAPQHKGAPTRAPDLAGLPRPLTRAIASALSSDPGGRPRDGTAWLEALAGARHAIERPRRARRIALLAGLGIVLGLAIAGLATWRVWERQVPGGRPTVAVADFANETGEKDLDSIGGLLVTALEQGTQLRVLTRGRMLDVLKQLGKGEVGRIDEPLAREVGREARANALLLASIRKLGEAYVVEMRALDPLHDEYVFTVRDRASGKGAVFELVDRLGAATRRKLGVAGGEPGQTAPSVASITTTSSRAWDLLSRSRLADHRGELKQSQELAEQAVKEDPDFALAHVALAEKLIERDEGKPEQEAAARSHLEIAERFADRLPEKERVALRILRAWVNGEWDEVRRLRMQQAEAYPLDKDALYSAGEILLRTGHPDQAIGYLERALALDPTSVPIVQSFVSAVNDTGQADRHVATLHRLASVATAPGSQLALSTALLAAGEEEAAVSLYRKGAAGRKLPWPNWVYRSYLSYVGRAPEAEQLMRSELEQYRDAWSTRPNAVFVARGNLANAIADQGRLREARAEYPKDAIAPGSTTSLLTSIDFDYCLVSGRVERAFELAHVMLGHPEAASPSVAYKVLEGLAMSGDLRGAARLAAQARQRLGAQWDASRQGGRAWLVAVDQYERPLAALVALGNGDGAEAERLLRALRDDPVVKVRARGDLLLGELARERGDCATAVRHLEAVYGLRWSFALDLELFRLVGLHALAGCHEKLGDVAKARERNEELLRLWANADPDSPRLIEAKAMKARLDAR
jgi:tetratricopeptide (TPR) repeat protein